MWSVLEPNGVLYFFSPRLKTQEQTWRDKINQNNSNDLLTNCVLAAAYLTYCPALSVDGRYEELALSHYTVALLYIEGNLHLLKYFCNFFIIGYE